MKKVIVTGADGFVGSALVKSLISNGYFVYAVVKDKKQLHDEDNINYIEAEFKDYINLESRISDRSFDAFYHLAWNGTFGKSFEDHHRQLQNAAYAADALMAAVRLQCKRFVLAGTIVELEVKHYITTDKGEPRISCIYGAAKLSAEMICRTLAYQHKIGFNTAILASIYGPGDRSSMIQNVLIRALQEGKSPKLIQGENLYDWIYIDDVADALVAIEQKGQANRTYYVGHRELQTFESLVSKTRDIVAPNVGLRFGELQDKTVIDYFMIDREALFRDTGFVCKADFYVSIRKTAQWRAEQKAKEGANS